MTSLPWFTDFIGRQDDNRYCIGLNEPQDYYGSGTLQSLHRSSVGTRRVGSLAGDTWTLTGGINNIFDEHPPQVSPDVVTTSAGNSAAYATGYDYRGRRRLCRRVEEVPSF
ncbi:MAG: hypothetical protein R3B94_12140 [Hyphomonas sp.]